MLAEVVGHESDEDLYPADEKAHADLLKRIQEDFLAAESARQGYLDRWERWYKLFRSYKERKPGDWRSRAFMPIIFFVIETILPRLVAQMPSPIVNPVGPEDVDGAERMEGALDWAFDQSGAFEHVADGFWSALMYGTGILKTFHVRRTARKFQITPGPMQPITQSVPMPVVDPATGQPMLDLDDNPMTEDMPVLLGAEQGPSSRAWTDAVSYDGPACQAIDISNFFPAPGATSMEDAAYVIERGWRSVEWVREQIDAGVYRIPDGTTPEQLSEVLDDPQQTRLSSIGLGGGKQWGESQRLVLVWEHWTHEAVTHTLGEKIIVRRVRNPYSHGEMPYCRILDHRVAHEFWGVGEIEPLEGLQDLFNALTQSRIDQIKMTLLAPWLVDESALADRRELMLRPGALVRVKNNWGYPLEQIIQKVDFGDVPFSSFEETTRVMDMIERVSGVSDFQLGTDSSRRTDTATGTAIISEQGNTRFAHKLKMAELTGLRSLARHFGTILQQFMPDQLQIRIFGESPFTAQDAMQGEQPNPNLVQIGAQSFYTLTPEELQGAFDYDIASESSTQTESYRKDQDMSLYTMLVGSPYVNQMWLHEKVLRSFGVKDTNAALVNPMAMMPPGIGAGPTDPAAMGLPPAAPALEGVA